MSHRVTTQTQVKDRGLAIQALKKAGVAYREEGNFLRITSGSMSGATLDLSTGDITGDTDYGHGNQGAFSELLQHYGEAKYLLECNRQGITVESRNVDRNGDIVLICQMA